MARRLKPINFDLVLAGDEAESKRLLRDLLTKYPKGADGSRRKEFYAKHDDCSYNWDSPYYLSRAIGGDQNTAWGYTPEQIYKVFRRWGFDGLYFSEWDAAQMLHNIDFEIFVGAKRTRSSRRLSSRFGCIFNAIRRGELSDDLMPKGKKTWNVGLTMMIPALDPGWNEEDEAERDMWLEASRKALGTRHGHFKSTVTAESKEAAKLTAQALWGHLAVVHSADMIHIEDPLENFSRCEQFEKKMTMGLSKIDEQIAKLQKARELVEMMAEAAAIQKIACLDE